MTKQSNSHRRGRRNYLVPEDFQGFLTEEKAKEAFHYIDDNDSGRVAQSELLNAVVQIFRWVLTPIISILV